MILVAGEALIDLIVDPSLAVRAVPGGGPYNVARTIGRLGVDTMFLGRLSSDRFGTLLRTNLTKDGVDTSHAVITDDPTTLAIAELDEDGAASYRFYVAGTSAAGLAEADTAGISQRRIDAMHVGTLGLVMEPIGACLERLTDQVDSSTFVMLDPNCRPLATPDPEAYRRRIERMCARADVVKVSADDVAFLVPGLDLDSAARWLLGLGPAVVLLTDGGRAVVIHARQGVRHLDVPPVRVIDTVGAGDAFGGAFLAWWLSRALERDALSDLGLVVQAATAAITVAGLTVQQMGAEPPARADLGDAWPTMEEPAQT